MDSLRFSAYTRGGNATLTPNDSMLRLVRIPPPIVAASLTGETVVPSVTIAREFADPRLELLRLLHEACEIEHSLMVQYLYAAFSIRPQYSDLAGIPDPKRSDCLLGVAVQEMRHLGHVNRLLVQLGGQPNMARQDFPYESQIYPFEMKLERLTRSSLAKYVYAEAPAGALKEETLTLSEDKQFAQDVLRELRQEARFNHIGTLYQSVLGLLDELAASDPPAGLQEMRATILAIRAEGEGGHFEFFKKMFLGTAGSLATVANPWADPQSEQFPSLAVPENPTALIGHPDQIRDPRLLTIAQLGNMHYWIVLSLLHLSYEADHDLILGELAVSHMTGALYPLCQTMAVAGGGMPFDPLSLGYRQGLGDQGRTFVRWLLEETSRLNGRLNETDKKLAELCLSTSTHSINELDRTELPVPDDAATVIGAGPAGLAAACSLASRGIPVFLLEKANLVAGKVHSFRKDGRSIEHGVHGWWTGYLNFNRLLEDAGVNLDGALKEAESSNLVLEDGNGGSNIYKLKNFRFALPSPLHLFAQTVRAPYLRTIDALGFLKFGIHVLAFRHERDYRRYDRISFQQLMDDLGVPPRIQHLILQPFILSFDFAIPERVSAACGLSGLQFYVLPSQRSILTRWSKGLPAEKVFGPLVNYFKRSGGRLFLDSPVQSISITNNHVQGVTYQKPLTGPAANVSSTVIAEIPLAQIKEGSVVPVASTAGQCWILCTNGNFSALSARCTHQGCDVNWVEANRAFMCPCHGGRYDAEGKVLQGPPPAPLAKFETLVVGDSLQVKGSAQTETIRCQNVILAADTHAAQQVLRNSPGLDPNLVKNVGRLGTTPVIVVRLWFESLSVDPQQLESAITPEARFADNFFMLNSFSNVYDLEGAVLEVQSYRVDEWLDRSDDEVLEVVFRDLATFCADANRERMKSYEIQRHRALFTAYAPGRIELRPGAESGTEGLFLAGDWTEADWSVWMMERAIVSGLRAANAVLLRRGLQPIEIRRLPREGLLLRVSRRVCEFIRRVGWKAYPNSST